MPHAPSSRVLLMPNLKHLTYGISNLVSLITKTKLRLSRAWLGLRPSPGGPRLACVLATSSCCRTEPWLLTSSRQTADRYCPTRCTWLPPLSCTAALLLCHRSLVALCYGDSPHRERMWACPSAALHAALPLRVLRSHTPRYPHRCAP
jgi:hypothetical protein